MITLDNLILNALYLFLPVSLYLNYLTYTKNMEIKEKTILLEFVLIAQLFLLLRYDEFDSIYSSIIYTIPLLISYYKKEYKTAIIISIVLIVNNVLSQNISLIILLIEHLLYLVIVIKMKNKKHYDKYLLLSFNIIKLCTILLLQKEINYLTLTITLATFNLYSYLLMLFFKKGNQIVELNNVLKELEKEKLLRSSISRLTHELKNPIAVCNGYLEMMDIKNKEKTKKYLEIITSEIRRSKTIIDEFSSYGKLKKLELEEIDITLLIEETVEILEPLFKKNKVTITLPTEEDIYLLADYSRLKQVFINLLKNALEAKKEDEPLKVAIQLKEFKTKVKIKIIDNGKGMSEDTLSRIFEVFYTTKRNGNGIGMAYSKEVIELHGGNIKISSKENNGTKITIDLPKEKKSEDFNNKNY